MPKIQKKSPIHENADENITCDFGYGDISRFRSRLPHTRKHGHIVSSIKVRLHRLRELRNHLSNIEWALVYIKFIQSKKRWAPNTVQDWAGYKSLVPSGQSLSRIYGRGYFDDLHMNGLLCCQRSNKCLDWMPDRSRDHPHLVMSFKQKHSFRFVRPIATNEVSRNACALRG